MWYSGGACPAKAPVFNAETPSSDCAAEWRTAVLWQTTQMWDGPANAIGRSKIPKVQTKQSKQGLQ